MAGTTPVKMPPGQPKPIIKRPPPPKRPKGM
jgi:hypothetical protein